MKIHQKCLLMVKLITIVLTLFFLSTSGETADQIVEGMLEEHTARSVKVNGWHYYLCEEKDMNDSEHEGIFVLNKKNEEIAYKSISEALEVTLFIKKDKRCVWKIKVHTFAE